MTENEEIRLKIAKLKGWTVLPYPAQPKWQRPTASGVECLYELPNWPESIADAWELFEEFISENKHLSCGIAIEPLVSHEWVASLGYWRSYGATAPLAICKAWIAWKEGNG